MQWAESSLLGRVLGVYDILANVQPLTGGQSQNRGIILLHTTSYMTSIKLGRSKDRRRALAESPTLLPIEDLLGTDARQTY